MSQDVHTVAVVDGSTLSQTDRVVLALLPARANAAGGAGVAVTVVVTGLDLPPVYGVQATPSQAALVSVSAKTQAGFTVTLTPLSGSVSLAVGTVDIAVTA